jgi:3-hydroxyisobutyrate dehydrogenase
MGLATHVANMSGSPVPLGEAAERIYEDVLKRQPELARKDFSSVYQYLAAQDGKKVHLGGLASADGRS